MPRRGRASSPKPSGGSGGFMGAKSGPPARAAPPPPPPMVAQPQPRQPGLMAQMATTAAGVAVGSAVGHTLGAAMTGAMGGGGHSEPAQAQSYQENPQQFQQAPACQFELKQFIECTQTQPDISLCQGFNDLLKNCKLQHGIQ
ncbi:coiled-coil-helix-coiled-coil-helix domain-containing protein 2-like [Saccostrea echinata]|uniref:coiled-coil-helix-coiled-coil-helix domain-containing protein 2-like n=1 Tax=Saccostrea echinata TaxID=191078 RepID=UPI002A823DFB|nr:coiled-coil-helix-coiled-coil-helix domain-containing protein 2-like [Saccostrea echinata]